MSGGRNGNDLFPWPLADYVLLPMNLYEFPLLTKCGNAKDALTWPPSNDTVTAGLSTDFTNYSTN